MFLFRLSAQSAAGREQDQICRTKRVSLAQIQPVVFIEAAQSRIGIEACAGTHQLSKNNRIAA
jgi:hypothetical protein